MNGIKQPCPVCGHMTAQCVDSPGNYLWVCARGCDLSDYTDCEDCGALFRPTRDWSSVCGACYDPDATEEYPVMAASSREGAS